MSSAPISCITPHCPGLPVAVLPPATERGLRFSMVHCHTCGIAFVHPVPTFEELLPFYENYAYHGVPRLLEISRSIAKSLLASRAYRWQAGQARIGGLASLLETISGHSISHSLAIPASLARDSAILDYGFGAGGWLLSMRALGYRHLFGWDVSANGAARDLLRARGVEVLDSLPRRELFDCIRLEHVFEHLPDPASTLGSLVKSMRSGAALVMTMPSIHAWEPLESLGSSPALAYLQLPIHIAHHSRQSIRAFLTNAGLEVRDVRLQRPHGYLSVWATRA